MTTAMTDAVNRISYWANGVIDSILATPEMWGGAESVELQLLLMYEVVVLVHRHAEPREVLEAYQKFLGERFGLTNKPAHERGMAYVVDVNRAFMKSELPKLIIGVR